MILHGFFPGVQLHFVVMKEQKVIGIAQVGATLEFPFDKLVERIEVNVRPALRGEIAHGQPARAQHSKEIIAGEIFHRVHGGEDAGAAGQDLFDEPEGVGVADAVRQFFVEDGVVNGRKELMDITLQYIGVAAGKVLGAVKRFVRAFAGPVGVGVVDKAALPIGLVTAQRAWWTTRSGKGAALIRRSLRSRM